MTDNTTGGYGGSQSRNEPGPNDVELCARLRAEEIDPYAPGLRHVSYVNPDGPPAADAIERLIAERDELQGLLVTQEICSERLAGRVAELESALRPFAVSAASMDGDEPDSLFIYDSPESTMIDYGHLRQARAVLGDGFSSFPPADAREEIPTERVDQPVTSGREP